MIQLHLHQFEGPLSLLLYLIRKEEMDIFDINIQEITKQYLEYIRQMKELDLEFAGDFIAMASTLIQIKSKMLLPQYDENGDVVETEDPRKELVQRLLEYQKYQEASKMLQDRPWIGRDLYLRGSREDFTAHDEPAIELEEQGLFGLITSFHRVMRQAKKRVHNVAAKVQSIANRIMEIKDRLIPGQRVSLFELITASENRGRQLLITFLSLLELGKLGFVRLYQAENYADIHIETKKPIENEVISNVEEYDNIHSDEAADQMFAKAERDLQKEAELQEAFSEESFQEPSTTTQKDHGDIVQMDFLEDDSEGDNAYVERTPDLDDPDFQFEPQEIASDEDILQAERELGQDDEQKEQEV